MESEVRRVRFGIGTVFKEVDLMSRQIFKKQTWAWLFLVIAAVLSGSAQDKRKITVEWIYSDEPQEVFALPHYQWLDNNTALYCDLGRPKEEQALEVLDPRTGKRTVLVDAAKALQDLESILGKDGVPKSLPWPESVTGEGRYAAYSFGGDVYILDTAAARLTRATNTPEEEIGARFSPDGGFVAYVRGRNIYVYDLLRKTERPLTRDGSDTIFNGELSFMYGEDVFNREGTELWWSPDSTALAYLQIDVSGVTEFVYYDFQPFNPRVIKQRYPLVGEKIETARVGIAELSSGETTWIDVTGRPDEYVVHVDWLSGSRRLSVQTLNRDQDVLDVYFADRATGRTTPILKETDPAWVNVGDDLYFLKDGKRFIWGSERSGFKHLYLYDTEGKLLNPITKGNWAVRAPFQTGYWSGRSVVAVDEKSQQIYFTGLEKSSLERHLYRIRLDGSGMERLTREDGFHSVTSSPDGRFYFDLYSTASTPPSLFLCRIEGASRQALAGPKADVLSGLDIRTPEIFTVPADDGFALPAQLLKPKDFDPKKKYPVILYHYGGPSAPNVLNIWQGMNLFHQVLLDKGYLVFSVDNRSATAISKTLENMILHQMVGPNELQDLLAGVRWLKSQPFVDPDRVGIWGWSYGGCMTLLALTRSQEFKAGISVAPVTDQRFHEPKWAEFAMKRPQDRFEDWEAVSLLRYAKDLHGRLMIVHGTYDDNVRIQNTWAFVDALIQAGKNFDMMIYPMRKHGIADRPARINLFNKMVEFWTRNL
jgi:dipeptidyl-peptidase 4